eukprot:tig00020830_g14448.t1
MACVNLLKVDVLDNPTTFLNPYQFEICYECLRELPDDLEWKITYIGSAEDEQYDQVLDSVMVGPVTPGVHKFVFQADAPDWGKIPERDLLGVTAILVTCSYREKEFVRVGYYLNVEYSDPELKENPPQTPDVSKLVRNILSDKPRVTRFPIEWSDAPSSDMMTAMEVQ